MARIGSLRSRLISAVALATFIVQGTPALAGVTGNMGGTVLDNNRAPVAAATVIAVSPSQSARTTTDAGGRFILLSLAPDTYTVTISKANYQTTSFPGQVVFADQTLQGAYTIQKSLKTIAHVISASAGNLVKSGVGGDIYSVNSTEAAAAASLGGGGNLNNAYSAMAAVPGVMTNIGGSGWNNNYVFIRGQNEYYTGFEYDGIPVNRAFDNYNASTESTLGLQELQVYTGGGPASISTSGTSGFINQVIKTGTYPGFASLNGAIGTPTFYHAVQVEAGGATPDRNFSWYAGFAGNNQSFRFLNNSNGADFMGRGGIYGAYWGSGNIWSSPATPLADAGICNPQNGYSSAPAGCFLQTNGMPIEFGAANLISDRENVINFHVAVPHNNGLRDDIQIMYSSSALHSTFYDWPGMWQQGGPPGGGLGSFTLLDTGIPLCQTAAGCTDASLGMPAGSCAKAYYGYARCPFNEPYFTDGYTYDKPFGAVVATRGGGTTPPACYFQPSSDPHSCFASDLSLTNADGIWNDTGIAKLQYTHALSSTAYLRAFAYTFYSDWNQTGGNDLSFLSFCCSADYELITHTAGGELQFADQINSQNLINATLNYTTASVTRWNNVTPYYEVGPIGFYSGSGSSMKCFSPSTGAQVPCVAVHVPYNAPSFYWDTSGSGAAVTPPWITNTSHALAPLPFPSAGPAVAAGASWHTLWSGNALGAYNAVDPRFTSVSLSDQFRPSDKLMFDVAFRDDNYKYLLPNSITPATLFYANQQANYTCYNVLTRQVLTEPLNSGAVTVSPPAPAFYVLGDCNTAVDQAFHKVGATGWVHPNGTKQDGYTAPNFTANSPASYSLNYFAGRISGTYSQSPDTVWRASAGRYVQPPLSASVQYLDRSGDMRRVWTQSEDLGLFTPFHPIPGISSAQYDLSYERHFRGTDMSMKITPFFSDVANWQTQTFIGRGFVTQIPYGYAENYGAEFEFDKGDFTRNGFSGKLAVTYTNAVVQFQGIMGPNQIDVINQVITNFNQLTKAGGGSPCYTPHTARGTACGPRDILNPYYNMSAQPMLDPAGWYPAPANGIAPNLQYDAFFYQSPWTASLIANYRSNKFAITPSIQFASGNRYGTPLDVIGVDPRACSRNSANAGIAAPNPHQCDVLYAGATGGTTLGYLWIPNPQTGHFAQMGEFVNPNILTGNMSLSYDVSPKIKLQATVTNIFHSCFGGSSEPWTAAYPPSPNVCSYAIAGSPGGTYVSNFYNGKSPLDKVNGVTPYPWQLQSYIPGTGVWNTIPAPLNVYISGSVRI